jgi:probable rRNA maturation factor
MGNDPLSIDIIVNCTGPWALREDLLKAGCRAVLDAQGIPEAEISLTVMNDQSIQELNKEYFQKDWPTDVIAFALQGPDEPILGDIYLGYEQARHQASELQIPLDEELLRLAVHGTLHLLGYQHPGGDERFESEMFRIQEEFVRDLLE